MIDADWYQAAFKELAAWLPEQRGTFKAEEFRSEMLKKDIVPAHPNHWGVFFQEMARDGLIKKVGFDIGKAPGQHGNIVRTWARVG